MNTPDVRPARFLRRLAAILIDLFVLMSLLAALQFVLVWATGGQLQARLFLLDNRLLSYGFILLTVSWLPANLYFSLPESSRWQASIGKRLLKLTVVDTYGGRISLPRAVVRTTLKFLPWELGHISVMLLSDLQVSGISLQNDFPFSPETRFVLQEGPLANPVRVLSFVLLCASILLVVIHPKHQSLHDMVAGTLVTKR